MLKSVSFDDANRDLIALNDEFSSPDFTLSEYRCTPMSACQQRLF